MRDAGRCGHLLNELLEQINVFFGRAVQLQGAYGQRADNVGDRFQILSVDMRLHCVFSYLVLR